MTPLASVARLTLSGPSRISCQTFNFVVINFKTGCSNSQPHADHTKLDCVGRIPNWRSRGGFKRVETRQRKREPDSILARSVKDGQQNSVVG